MFAFSCCPILEGDQPPGKTKGWRGALGEVNHIDSITYMYIFMIYNILI